MIQSVNVPIGVGEVESENKRERENERERETEQERGAEREREREGPRESETIAKVDTEVRIVKEEGSLGNGVMASGVATGRGRL